MARQAARLGVEMFVLDDGWFGKRNDDKAGLGDWVVNEKKLPGGIARLSKDINGMGLNLAFGLSRSASIPTVNSIGLTRIGLFMSPAGNQAWAATKWCWT